MFFVRSAFRWSGAICLLAWVACGPNDPNDAESETDDGEFDSVEFRALTARWVCEPLARCCQLSWEGFGGEEGCIALFVVASFESFTDLGESIEAGRIAYDETRLRDCVEASEEMACDDVIANRYSDACDSFLTPLVPLGDFCTLDMDCIDGYCSDSTCVPDFADDEPCDEDSHCASMYCSDDADACRPANERDPLACY
jgi:hypothetical protein